MGVAAIQALTVRNTATMHASMAAHVTSSSGSLSPVLPDLQSSFGVASFNAEITRQATMVAYVDDYRLMAIISVLCFGLVFLLHQPGKRHTCGEPVFIDVGHA